MKDITSLIERQAPPQEPYPIEPWKIPPQDPYPVEPWLTKLNSENQFLAPW